MSDNDFIALVCDMRMWQRAYFNNGRDYSALRICRELEKKVDTEMRHRAEVAKPSQGKLI